MRALMRPGVRVVEALSPLGRVIFIVALFSAAFALALSADVLGRWTTAPAWFLLAAAAYMVVALVTWTQIGLSRIVQVSEQIARGDLTRRLRIGAGAEGSDADRMWASLAQMSVKLSEIVQQVNASCDTILNGARRMSQGSSDLSRRTEEQAATLEQTSSGMEQMTATVRQNADNCGRASGLAVEGNEIARKSVESMRQVVGAMRKMQAGSARMGEIVGVIESIAFQTNILALNAAVEAAHAGDQGRGFAVVASEVRSLAQRSAGSVKDIKDLIAESIAAISESCASVEATGATMEKALGSANEVARVIGEIARASSEQSSGIEEMSRATAQLEKVTQENASLVEQIKATALTFEEQAERLAGSVSAFKLDSVQAGAPPASAGTGGTAPRARPQLAFVREKGRRSL